MQFDQMLIQVFKLPVRKFNVTNNTRGYIKASSRIKVTVSCFTQANVFIDWTV